MKIMADSARTLITALKLLSSTVVLFSLIIIMVPQTIISPTAIVVAQQELSSSSSSAAVQKIVEEPEDQTVIIGQTVKLLCRVENQVGAVLWSRKGFLLGAQRSLPAYPRYSMIGSSAKGEYHLEIKDIHLSDENTYQCQISAMQDQPLVMSRVAKLTVLVPPSVPKLIDVDDRTLIGREGFPVSAQCSVQGGKPPATVEWVIAEDEEARTIVRQLPQEAPTEVLTQNNLFDSQSTLQFIAQSEENGKYLVCLSKHPALEHPSTAAVLLRIKSKPKVNITLNSSMDSLTENGFAVLSCNVLNTNVNMNTRDANLNMNTKKNINNKDGNEATTVQPENLEYTWFHNGRLIKGATSPTLHIQNLNRSNHHNSFYACKVKNEVGESEAVHKLEIRYAPYFKSIAQKFIVQDGDTVSFSCAADSNPPPKRIKWTKMGNPDWPGYVGQNLTLEKVNYGNEGKYNCEVITDYFPSIYQTYSLYIKGPPRVEISNTPDAVEGGSAKIYCKVTGYPKPPENNITWHKGGSLLNPALNHRFEVSYVRPNEDEVYSILIVKRAFLNDFDVYNCTASNELGSASASTKLIESTSFPMYVMVPGVVGGCVAILVIAMAIVWANRKYLCKSKSSTTHSSDDQSDLTVKVEDLGNSATAMGVGGYFPNIYSRGPGETVELLGTKTYVPIPQDNPDFDALPAPPYHPYMATANHNAPNDNASYVNGGANTYTPPLNGNVIRAVAANGFIDGDRGQVSPHPPMYNHHHHHHLSTVGRGGGNSPLLLDNGYATYVPPMSSLVTFGRYPMVDHMHHQHQLHHQPYIPTTTMSNNNNGNGGGLYLQALETVPEVSTPDGMDDQNGGVQRFNIPRCASQISTHV